MRIGEIADETGVPTKTIRFWEAEGLLPEPARTASGYRDYLPAITERLAFIRQAQRAGLRLGEIRQVLDISDAGNSACHHVLALIDQRLLEIDDRIAELTQARHVLQQLAERATTQDPSDCRGYCRILSR